MTRKATLLSSLVAAVALGAILLLVWDRLRDPYFSSPEKERPWARESLFNRLSPIATGPIPLLKSHPPPTPSIEKRGANLGFKMDVPDSLYEGNIPWEILRADDRHAVTLRENGTLQLEAIALSMPHDGEWTDPYPPEVPLVFLDPITLESLPASRTENWPGVDGSPLREDGSRLFLVFSHPETTAFHWHSAESFDDRTLAPASGTNGHRVRPGIVLFDLDLGIWHQTPLRITVDFSYGTPDTQQLTLQESEEIVFGNNDGMVRVLRQFPEGIESRTWGFFRNSSGGTSYDIEISPETAKTSPSREQGLVLLMWPPCNQRLIDFRYPRSNGGIHQQMAYGAGGIASLELRGHAATLESIEARRLPHLGRAVFLLPRLPRLPEVENLFDAPIPLIRFRSPYQMQSAIELGAGIEWIASKNQPSSALFPLTTPKISPAGVAEEPDQPTPLTMTNTTPLGLVEKHNQLSGRALYFDRKHLILASDPPPSLKDRLIEWIKDALP